MVAHYKHPGKADIPEVAAGKRHYILEEYCTMVEVGDFERRLRWDVEYFHGTAVGIAHMMSKEHYNEVHNLEVEADSNFQALLQMAYWFAGSMSPNSLHVELSKKRLGREQLQTQGVLDLGLLRQAGAVTRSLDFE